MTRPVAGPYLRRGAVQANPVQGEDVAGDDVRLSMTKHEFTAIRDRGDAWADETGATSSRSTRVSGEDIRVPVAEEVDVVKRERDAGQVRLRKEVVTETKHVDVPVTREEVHVERTPVTDRREATGGDAAFQEGTVSVPIHEEEVEIRKRPVVKEEVRLRKERVRRSSTGSAASSSSARPTPTSGRSGSRSRVKARAACAAFGETRKWTPTRRTRGEPDSGTPAIGTPMTPDDDLD